MARRTVLLTGAAGLLGTWLRRTVPPWTTVVPVLHRTPLPADVFVYADLRNERAVASAVEGVRPDLVIHAAYALDEPSIVDATRNLVAAAGATGARMLLVSTDAVFSGDGSPRAEDATPDPVWDYGRWKVEAEEMVSALPGSCVVRLPLIVSLDPPDHAVRRIQDGADTGKPTAWFDDEVRQPAQAGELAEALWRIVSLAPDEAAGVWHLMGPESLTRYEIASRVVGALDLDPSSVSGEPTPTAAVRPRHLDLTDARARSSIDWAPTPVLLGP